MLRICFPRGMHVGRLVNGLQQQAPAASCGWTYRTRCAGAPLASGCASRGGPPQRPDSVGESSALQYGDAFRVSETGSEQARVVGLVRPKSASMLQRRMATLGRGRVRLGGRREYSYASVEIMTFGNSAAIASAIRFTARRSGPDGEPPSWWQRYTAAILRRMQPR